MSYTSGVNAAKMQSAYKWGTWEEGSFTQCGIEVVQHPDFSIQLRKEKALTSCPRFTCLEIGDRSRQTECPTTDEEKRKLPGAPGSL